MLYGIVIAAATLKNGDPEEFKKASVRLKERTAQLKQYCSEHDLTYMNERTSVLGYSHSEASKVTAAYKKTLQNEQLTLDNITKGGIINSKGMPDYGVAITQDAIDSVPIVEVEGFDEARNLKLQQAQKDILTEAAKHPVGTEVGAIYEADTMKRIGTNYSVGKPGGVSVQIPSANVPYIAIHNHPDRATLSPADVRKIFTNPTMEGMIAIGNDASFYMLQPLDNVDISGYSDYLENSLKGLKVLGYSYYDIINDNVDFSNIDADLFYQTYSKAMEDIWKASENYGFKYTQIHYDESSKRGL